MPSHCHTPPTQPPSASTPSMPGATETVLLGVHRVTQGAECRRDPKRAVRFLTFHTRLARAPAF